MELNTERLLLKPICTDHLESYCEYACDPEVCRFMVLLPKKNKEEALSFLKAAEEEAEKDNPLFYEFAVFYCGIHIGGVSLYIEDDFASGEIGWILNKKYHGHGFATEAAAALKNYAVTVLGINHLIAHCDTENTASRRVMEKLGMNLKGEYGGRKNKLSDEERREYLYSLSL